MPDLDQLLDSLVADVTGGTRAPGARSAITRARRRRAAVAVAAVGAVASVAVVVAIAAGIRGGDRLSPVGEPTPRPSPTQPSTVWETAGSRAALYDLGQELDAILTAVPGWGPGLVAGDVAHDYDYAFNGPCAGNWAKGANSGSDGAAPNPSRIGAGIGSAGFRSASRASDAAGAFVENLESCTATAWRTRPIAQTGATIASSATGVAWIQQTGNNVRVLQVATTDGPPPLDVQVEIADWMVAYDTWQEQAGQRD